MNVVRDIINIFYPAECHLCSNSLAPHEKFICTSCISTLPRTGYHRNHKNPMVERFAGQFPFVNATGHFFYSKDSSLSQLIQDMKYRGFPSIGKKLGYICGQELYPTGYFNDISYIIPLPMHFLKKARRGYNQTDYIAKGLSESTGVSILEELKMVRRRKTQTSLSQLERLENAEGLFKTRKLQNLEGKGVMLIDDICTTGATLGAAARTLTEEYPGIRLYLFTVGVTF